MRFINGMISMITFALIVIAMEEARGAHYSEEFRLIALMIGASMGFTATK